MNDSVEPAAALSAASDQPEPGPAADEDEGVMVAAANAMRTLNPRITQDQVAMALPSWSRFREMTMEEAAIVIRLFPKRT